MSNTTPIVPFPEDADAANPADGENLDAATTEREDGTRVLDPDVADELIDGVDADRIAAESGEAHTDDEAER